MIRDDRARATQTCEGLCLTIHHTVSISPESSNEIGYTRVKIIVDERFNRPFGEFNCLEAERILQGGRRVNAPNKANSPRSCARLSHTPRQEDPLLRHLELCTRLHQRRGELLFFPTTDGDRAKDQKT